MLPLSIVVEDSFSRPANTTQYAAGDQVSDSATAPTPLEFSNAAQLPGGAGVILSAICISSANQATKPNLRLYVFDAEPTPSNDNAAWAPADSDVLNLVAVVEFTSWHVGKSDAGADGNAVSIVSDISSPFRTQPSSKSLYGLLVERGTYTPVSAESFTVRLGILQD